MSAVEDAVQTLAGENLLRMMHTHEGAAAASMVVAYGTAKDRKAAVKAMNCALHPLPAQLSHPHAPTPLPVISIIPRVACACMVVYCQAHGRTSCKYASCAKRLRQPPVLHERTCDWEIASVHCPVSKLQQHGFLFVHAAHVKSMATDQYAHLVLVTALSRVDDTALLRKNIITELQVCRKTTSHVARF